MKIIQLSRMTLKISFPYNLKIRSNSHNDDIIRHIYLKVPEKPVLLARLKLARFHATIAGTICTSCPLTCSPP